jgi:phosphatidylserine/phosphatidylglycerophosphate/cardiolipin synthase-like enzyme
MRIGQARLAPDWSLAFATRRRRAETPVMRFHGTAEEAALLSREPPGPLVDREARVALHLPNSLRVPCDTPPADPKRWFRDDLSVPGSSWTRDVSEGNEVTYLIDGPQTFRAMVDAIETATDPGHFIYLLGWFLGDRFPLVRGDQGTTMEALLQRAHRGVHVRALLWGNPATTQNVDEVDRINALPYGRAIVDTRLLHSCAAMQFSKQRLAALLAIPVGATLMTMTAPELALRQVAYALLELGGGTTIYTVRAGVALSALFAALGLHAPSGSHHQKILIVNGSRGLVAFCGGIDINPDRIDAANVGHNVGDGVTPGSPMHDVHCRITGPAARVLLKTFVERWEDHPANNEAIAPSASGPGHFAFTPDELKRTPEAMQVWNERYREERAAAMEIYERRLRVHAPEELPAAPASGHQYVQIGRTFGNGSAERHGGLWDLVRPARPYRFAPAGERTIKEIVVHAIQQARRFIYIEDQYLTPIPEVVAALKQALTRIAHLTIVIPDDTITGLGGDIPIASVLLHYAGEWSRENVHVITNQARGRRQDFIRALKADSANAQKVRVFTLSPAEAHHTYVHTKLYIVDDELAIIGSANCNRRSFTHDSEVLAAIADQPVTQVVGFNFAHRLRIALWAEHLGMLEPAGSFPPTGQLTPQCQAQLADGVASAVHWLAPGTRVAPYDDTLLAARSVSDDLLWDRAVDPDGS